MPSRSTRRFLHVDHIFDGDERETASVGHAGGGVDVGRTRRSPATPEYVRADDEQAIGVDGLAGADKSVPPARLVVFVVLREMRVARNRMTDEHRIAAVLIERPVGLVGDLDARKRAAVAELHGRRKDSRFARGEVASRSASSLCFRSLRPREAASLPGGDCKRLVDVGDDVFDVLDADRNAHVLRHNAGLLLLLRGSAAGAWSTRGE